MNKKSNCARTVKDVPFTAGSNGISFDIECVDWISTALDQLLIGLNAKDEITFWNSATEGTFGILSRDVLGIPFSKCGIRWQQDIIASAFAECREKKGPVKINDVRFLRPNMEEGFLGLTIIPVKTGYLDVLIFGADLTERKKLEHLKDEFISTVSHELRTPLTIIREGVSQVLEGILGETTEHQRKFLSIALQAIDRLSRIINDLLDISKIESDKLELKMDLVDLTVLVQELVASPSPYQMKAKNKGLMIQALTPPHRVECYLARDKIIQVFTNLIENALKFTEQGTVEILIQDQGDHVQCSVADTGIGISKEDLPKVFHKFQQFGRTPGPGGKGTGLGLAISKGLVEMHKGKIWIEGERDKGAKFTFVLPKLRGTEILRQYVSSGIRKAKSHKSSMTCIQFNVSNFDLLKKELSKDKIAEFIEEFQTCIKKSLRNRADFSVRFHSGVFALLPSTNKQDGYLVAERIKRDYEKLEAHPLSIQYCIASFPEDGQREDELIELFSSERKI